MQGGQTAPRAVLDIPIARQPGGGWTFRNIYIDCEATAITEYSGFGGKCLEIHKILDYLKHLEKLFSVQLGLIREQQR